MKNSRSCIGLVGSITNLRFDCFRKTILTSKSFLCGITLLRSNVNDEQTLKSLYQINKQDTKDYYHKSLEDVVELANLETIFQTGEWGEVEDTHDVDKHDWLRNLASAALVCH